MSSLDAIKQAITRKLEKDLMKMLSRVRLQMFEDLEEYFSSIAESLDVS